MTQDALAALAELREWLLLREQASESLVGTFHTSDAIRFARWAAAVESILSARESQQEDARDADTRRLDWLSSHPRDATVRVGGDMKACVFYGISCDPKWSFREAIDAALAAKGEGK